MYFACVNQNQGRGRTFIIRSIKISRQKKSWDDSFQSLDSLYFVTSTYMDSLWTEMQFVIWKWKAMQVGA